MAGMAVRQRAAAGMAKGSRWDKAWPASREEAIVSSLSIFIIGFVILIAGLAYGANMAGMSPQWIAVGVAVLAGIGVVMGVTKTRMKDPSHD